MTVEMFGNETPLMKHAIRWQVKEKRREIENKILDVVQLNGSVFKRLELRLADNRIWQSEMCNHGFAWHSCRHDSCLL